MKQWAAGRKGVGSGAGGGGNDQAVGPLVRHKVAVHLNAQLHHARGGAPAHRHIVHGQCIKHAVAIAHDFGMHQAAMVFLMLAAQHGGKRFLKAFKGYVSDEAQAPLVYADQRHAKAGQLSANAQHGAVASHHQPQIALGTNGRHIQYGVPR